ncbi:hypothetical protein DCS_06253 [Drechmeria coniospora]|uniref:Uncharacterized protein n=1 Tax=Drechmeria coniospora TaxID=98403 RepID=A0A151GB03_DRECN|nr:hypothetical protein DCS_06253 [Drechmeria coniospora]KYK54296.1 hypothetical protein DCS_06253 [Drechmeria coniospora]
MIRTYSSICSGLGRDQPHTSLYPGGFQISAAVGGQFQIQMTNRGPPPLKPAPMSQNARNDCGLGIQFRYTDEFHQARVLVLCQHPWELDDGHTTHSSSAIGLWASLAVPRWSPRQASAPESRAGIPRHMRWEILCSHLREYPG